MLYYSIICAMEYPYARRMYGLVVEIHDNY